MQQQSTPARPLSTPRALRRSTGAHAVLVLLVLADLVGALLALVLGALFGALLEPPARWLVQASRVVLHASLPLDIAALVILCYLANAILRQYVQNKDAEFAWGCTIVLFLVVAVSAVILFFAKHAWIAIPSPVFPPAELTPLSWSPPPSALGIEVAAGLYLLAHVALWRRERRDTAEKLRTFSRAHEDGRLCRMLEQVYTYYRLGLARFAPPPIEHLKTPRMFYFYSRRAPGEGEDELDAMAHPEREIYLVGRELVICQSHVGPKSEQVEVLMPLVARRLHDYNSPVAWVERLLHLAELAKASEWYYLLLPVPLVVAQSCERRWQELERDRVLDRDRFAWECGEGGRLRKLLHRQLGYLDRTNQPDNTVPTLAERVDHLDSLLKREARQIKKLREALPPVLPTSPTAP